MPLCHSSHFSPAPVCVRVFTESSCTGSFPRATAPARNFLQHRAASFRPFLHRLQLLSGHSCLEVSKVWVQSAPAAVKSLLPHGSAGESLLQHPGHHLLLLSFRICRLVSHTCFFLLSLSQQSCAHLQVPQTHRASHPEIQILGEQELPAEWFPTSQLFLELCVGSRQRLCQWSPARGEILMCKSDYPQYRWCLLTAFLFTPH